MFWMTSMLIIYKEAKVAYDGWVAGGFAVCRKSLCTDH